MAPLAQKARMESAKMMVSSCRRLRLLASEMSMRAFEAPSSAVTLIRRTSLSTASSSRV